MHSLALGIYTFLSISKPRLYIIHKVIKNTVFPPLIGQDVGQGAN
jgi:hypothetical protein